MNIPLPVILSVAKDPIVRPAEDIELDSSLALRMTLKIAFEDTA